MASCSSLLSEEQVLCSICLEVFTEPVSIPCGHNFCKVCISNYWDTTDLCQCPLCKNKFYRRPELCVNTTFRDVVENVKMMMVRGEESPARPGEVPCDVCIGRKLKALKSCLVCQTSYCETHLEPHLRVAALKKHKLIHPVENLEDRMCKKHDKPLALFCRKDQTCVCLMCMNTDHKTHNAVPLEEECGQMKAKLANIKVYIDQMMKTRSMKVQQIKHSAETSKRDAEREISDSVEVLTALVSSIERRQAELIQVIVEKQEAAEKRASWFIKELEEEITELNRRSSELEHLCHSEDHLHLLLKFPSLITRPNTKDWSEISVHSGLSVETVMRGASLLEDTLMREIKKLCEAELKRVQQYAVNVTLDPDTAHPKLILSKTGKQVRDGDTWKNLPDNEERFDRCVMVLGKQSFSSGRFYYEVQVEGKTKWDLGVARESVNRKGKITLSPEDGYWTIRLRNEHEYMSNASPVAVLLHLREKPQKVGVFVDYEEGQVSFYNVEVKSHMYSFTGCTFTEKLYPFFSPCIHYGGKNSVPLIITPVHTRRSH